MRQILSKIHYINARNTKKISFFGSQSMMSLSFARLPERSVLRVQGKESAEFLQGVITNDINNCIEPQDKTTFSAFQLPLIYSLMLNPKGRINYDLMIYGNSSNNDETTQSFFLECNASRAQSLVTYLKRYRLRKKIDICCEPEIAVWAAFLNDEFNSLQKKQSNIAQLKTKFESYNPAGNLFAINLDPRFSPQTFRSSHSSSSFSFFRILAPSTTCVTPAATFDYHRVRIACGVAEGVRDLSSSDQSVPLECNGHELGGISFDKGCYIGQELTARTYHTGVTRKRLMPLQLFISSTSSSTTSSAGQWESTLFDRILAANKSSNLITSQTGKDDDADVDKNEDAAQQMYFECNDVPIQPTAGTAGSVSRKNASGKLRSLLLTRRPTLHSSQTDMRPAAVGVGLGLVRLADLETAGQTEATKEEEEDGDDKKRETKFASRCCFSVRLPLSDLPNSRSAPDLNESSTEFVELLARPLKPLWWPLK